VCQAEPTCCKSAWDATCVAKYEGDLAACNASPLCNYLGSSDVMTPAARADHAGYTP
jgi:hypothetical protein